jgi:hypothetical protein
MKRPQFNIHKRTRTGTTVLDVITAKRANQTTTERTHPTQTTTKNRDTPTTHNHDTDMSDDDSDDEGINPNKTDCNGRA